MRGFPLAKSRAGGVSVRFDTLLRGCESGRWLLFDVWTRPRGLGGPKASWAPRAEQKQPVEPHLREGNRIRGEGGRGSAALCPLLIMQAAPAEAARARRGGNPRSHSTQKKPAGKDQEASRPHNPAHSWNSIIQLLIPA